MRASAGCVCVAIFRVLRTHVAFRPIAVAQSRCRLWCVRRMPGDRESRWVPAFAGMTVSGGACVDCWLARLTP